MVNFLREEEIKSEISASGLECGLHLGNWVVGVASHDEVLGESHRVVVEGTTFRFVEINHASEAVEVNVVIIDTVSGDGSAELLESAVDSHSVSELANEFNARTFFLSEDTVVEVVEFNIL